MAEVVLFEPTEKQQQLIEKAFDDNYRFVSFGGSAGGGKTIGTLGTLIMFSRVYAKSKWCVIRKSLTELKLSTIPSFWKIAPTNYITNWNKSENEVTFKNGSKIIFKGENIDQDPELQWMDGFEVNGFLLEQAEELERATFNKAVLRAGRNVIDPMPTPKIILTFNPAQNWVRQEIYDRWKEGKLTPPHAYIPAKITDNGRLPKEYLDGLKYLDSYTYKRWVDGDWDAFPKTGQEYFSAFDINRHVGETNYDPEQALHITLDFNRNPYMTLLVFQVKLNQEETVPRYKVQVLKEYCLRHPYNKTQYVCQAFKKDFESHAAGLFYYGDATANKENTFSEPEIKHDYDVVERELWAMLNNHSRRVRKNNPRVLIRKDFMNQCFEGKTIIDIIIDRSCVETINDFVYLKETPNGKKFKQTAKDPVTNKPYEKYGHTSDALEYGIFESLKDVVEQYTRR